MNSAQLAAYLRRMRKDEDYDMDDVNLEPMPGYFETERELDHWVGERD